jgi:ribonuclease HI
MTITAAADGSALGNPGPAGWTWYIDDGQWRSGGWAHGTNNMGELMAVLDLFRSTAHLPDEELHILCDSQYVINSVTKWMPGWKKKGWKKSDGKPVLNQEILRELDTAIVGRKYTFEWVKGHSGHQLNEEADDRARAAAIAHQSGKTPASGPGYVGSSAPAIAGGEAAQPEPDSIAEENASLDVTGTVFELEQGLLDAQVRTNFAEVNDFLHPGYQEICRDGSLLDVNTVRSILDGAGTLPETGPVQLLTARLVDTSLVLIAYRMNPANSPVLVCSSWWQETSAGWKLRFRQETVENQA